MFSLDDAMCPHNSKQQNTKGVDMAGYALERVK